MGYQDEYLSVTVLSGSLSSLSSVECDISSPSSAVPLRGPGLRGPPREPRGMGSGACQYTC